MKEIRIVNQRRIPAYYWDPWVGCEKVSAGCLNCFIIEPEFRFQGIYQQCFDDEKAYGNLVLTTLHSDFFIDKADEYRNAAWEFIKNKPNSLFLIVTKRVERIKDCLPADWNDGYDNVIISVTTETQEMVEHRIPIFREVRAKHKWLSVSPLIEQVDLSKYLAEGWIEHIEVSGEKAFAGAVGRDVRPLYYEWVEDLSNQCKKYDVKFSFLTCGSNFKYNGKTFHDHCPCYKSCLANGLELNVEKQLRFELKDIVLIL